MSSSINKPTGYGYSSSLQRECVECGHKEWLHYEKTCYAIANLGDGRGGEDCTCFGFTARQLTEEERKIILDKKIVELEYVDEAYILDLKEDWKRIRIEGIDD